MSLRLFLSSAGMLLCLAPLASAQAPAAAPPKPGPEHKALQYFVGSWTTEADMKANPMMPAGKFTSSDTCELFSGGFYVVCKSTGKGPSGPMSSLGIMGYDMAQKTYTYYGADNMGYGGLSTGSKSGSTWTFTSTMDMGGSKMESRFTINEVSATAYTFTWAMGPAGNVATIMEGKATKKGPAGSR